MEVVSHARRSSARLTRKSLHKWGSEVSEPGKKSGALFVATALLMLAFLIACVCGCAAITELVIADHPADDLCLRRFHFEEFR